MKVDNFVLLIISTVTLIVISLVTECNKGRLKELENKATNDIVESFYHMGSATPTEAGEWGYKITSLTHGKYGGRSRQDVLSNLGSHNVNDYITEDELSSYGSALSISKSGDELDGVDCLGGDSQPAYNDDCNKHVNNKLVYFYDNYEPAEYGGSCSSDIFKHTDGLYYEYITDNNVGKYDFECASKLNNSELLSISLNGDNTLNIVEPTWAGFLKSIELSNLLFGNDNGLEHNITVKTSSLSETLISNQIHNGDSNLLNNYNHKKYYKNNKYYTLSIFNAYRYYKINVTKTVQDGNPLSFAQLALYDENDNLIIGAGITHTAASATLTGSSQHVIASLEGAFDNEISAGGINMNGNIFHTNSSLGTGVLQIDFGSGGAKTVGMYRIWIRPEHIVQAPTNWTFEASNDGVNWVILDIRNNHTDWSTTSDISGENASDNIDRAKEFRVNGVEIHPGEQSVVDFTLILDKYGALQGQLPPTLNVTNPPIITNIYSTEYAFAALDVTGKVHVWGNPSHWGGQLPPTLDPDILNTTPPPIITNISSTKNAFAALDVNRNVHVWGHNNWIHFPATLYHNNNPPKITNIYSTEYGFAALDVTGKLYVWGNPYHKGGQLPPTLNVTNPPKIRNIYSGIHAFAALDVTGKVHVWGSTNHGGQLPDILTNSTITKMFSANYTFTALTSDHRVVKWGKSTSLLYATGEDYDKIGENSSGEKVTVIYNVSSMSIVGNTVTAIHIDGTPISWGNDSQSNNNVIPTKFLT